MRGSSLLTDHDVACECSHLYTGLAILLAIGYNGPWPSAPKNIPSGDYDSY